MIDSEEGRDPTHKKNHNSHHKEGHDHPISTAKEIYNALITRCKAYVKARTSVVYDPTTGVQKTFVNGKLTEVRKVRVGRTDPP